METFPRNPELLALGPESPDLGIHKCTAPPLRRRSRSPPWPAILRAGGAAEVNDMVDFDIAEPFFAN